MMSALLSTYANHVEPLGSAGLQARIFMPPIDRLVADAGLKARATQWRT